MTGKSPYQVQSVARATALLEAIRAEGAPRTARELADAVGIERTVAYRLLRTLEQARLVVGVDGRWHLDYQTLRLGTAYLEEVPFKHIGRTYAIELNRQVVQNRPWVVSVALPVGGEVMLIDQIWSSSSPLDSIAETGTRFPLDASATGHAILAHMSGEMAEKAIGTERWEAVKGVLRTVREAGGVAFAKETLRPGISAIAVAILDRRRKPVGAINISGLKLEDHLNPDSDVASHLKRTAVSIGAALPH